MTHFCHNSAQSVHFTGVVQTVHFLYGYTYGNNRIFTVLYSSINGLTNSIIESWVWGLKIYIYVYIYIYIYIYTYIYKNMSMLVEATPNPTRWVVDLWFC